MKKVLLIGSTGLVGSRIQELLSGQYQLISPRRQELDILNKELVTNFVKKHSPDVIVNLAAYTNVNEAEEQTGNKDGLCWQINVEGVNNLLKTVNKNTQFIHISTDMVFSGGVKDPGPYKENHPLPDSHGQLTWYGWTKNRGEHLVRNAGHIVIRIIYPVRASFSRPDYIRSSLRKYKAGNLHPLFKDQQLTITLIDNLAQAISTIIDQDVQGDTFHVCSSNTGTALDIIKTTIKKLGANTSQIKSASLVEYLSKQKNPYRYPVNGGLDVQITEKKLNIKFPTWQAIIDKLIKQGLTIDNA